MSKRLPSQSSPSQSSLRASTSSKDKPLRFDVRHLDIEIKQRQRAKVVVRQKQRRKKRTMSLLVLVMASLVFVNLSNGNLQRLTQSINTGVANSVARAQTAVFETRQRIVDIPKVWRVKRFAQVEQISLPKNNPSAPASLGIAQPLGVVAQPQESFGSLPISAAPAPMSIYDITTRRIKVALQIGHLNVANHPKELANLRLNTGGLARGVAEIDVNKAVANIVKKQLEYYGITVELLPATVPPDYKADLFVSIHADSSIDIRRRGYKSAYAVPERNTADKLLKSLIDESFFNASGLPDDHKNVSSNMTEYYAFNKTKFIHSIASETPALIVEMGYLSHEEDIIFLKDTKRPATALTEGILKFLDATGEITHLPYQPNYALQVSKP